MVATLNIRTYHSTVLYRAAIDATHDAADVLVAHDAGTLQKDIFNSSTSCDAKETALCLICILVCIVFNSKSLTIESSFVWINIGADGFHNDTSHVNIGCKGTLQSCSACYDLCKVYQISLGSQLGNIVIKSEFHVSSRLLEFRTQGSQLIINLH